MAKAKRESPCGICHNMIRVGEEINIHNGRSCHESCIGNNYRPVEQYIKDKRVQVSDEEDRRKDHKWECGDPCGCMCPKCDDGYGNCICPRCHMLQGCCGPRNR